MKSILFLHSTTGNTRLVARFAADRLKQAGHSCKIHDITRHRDAPADLLEYDLVGFACPTMYWRPTLPMEKFVARLPPAGAEPKAVFQIATAGGDPGAQFALLAEQGLPVLQFFHDLCLLRMRLLQRRPDIRRFG